MHQGNTHPANQLGTLGTGNHFIEVCLDESDDVWFMLHSGSRGVGNRTGMHFIQLAQKDMGRHLQNLPDKDLAYFEEGSELCLLFIHPPAPWVGSQPCGAKYPGFCADSKGV